MSKAGAALHDRVRSFTDRMGLQTPILLAPMAGACPPSLSVAVMRAGGMGSCGALLMKPEAIGDWADTVRSEAGDAFQMNIWIPGRPPVRDCEAEAEVRKFLANWGPEVPPDAGDGTLPDFSAQCAAMLDGRPRAISSVMGLYDADFVKEMKARGILWVAGATTVEEAKAAEAAGADVILAQGMEAGGHRGSFDPDTAGTRIAGTMSLVPAVVNAVDLPVIAAGGIADGRGVAAALVLGASAVAIGTGFLRSPEARIAPAWAAALAATGPDETRLTRAFSGRLGRTVRTAYVEAAESPDTPEPAPYPVQRGLTLGMRTTAAKTGNLDGIQAWAGQSAWLARDIPAGDILRTVWADAQALLPGSA